MSGQTFKPLGMDASAYLTLPADERKRLAAKRSRERSKARNKGLELPPTIEEELGIKKRKPKKEKKAKKEVKEEEHFDEEGKKLTKEEWLERVNNPVVFAPRGPVESSLRTIRGCPHWVQGYDESRYDREARDRGLAYRIPYFNGDRLIGRIYFNDLPTEDFDALRAIFLASKGVNVVFGEKEQLN